MARSKEVEMLQSKLQAFSEAFDGVGGDLDEPLSLSQSGPQAQTGAPTPATVEGLFHDADDHSAAKTEGLASMSRR